MIDILIITAQKLIHIDLGTIQDYYYLAPIPAMAIAAGIQAGTGLAQTIGGMIKRRQADKATPPLEDPEQRALLDEINRKRRLLERGGGAGFALGSGLIGRQLSQSQRNVLRATGGNVGAALSGLSMTQRAAGDQTNKLIAQQQQEAGFYTQMAAQETREIAQRKFALQMAERLQKLRESAELKQSGMENIMSGAAMLLPLGKGGAMGGATGGAVGGAIGGGVIGNGAIGGTFGEGGMVDNLAEQGVGKVDARSGMREGGKGKFLQGIGQGFYDLRRGYTQGRMLRRASREYPEYQFAIPRYRELMEERGY